MAKADAAAGFTLIEVVTALAIVAITTMIAASSYQNHVLRSHRVQAVQALLVAAVEQEKFHLTNGRYGDRLDAVAGQDPPGLPLSSQTTGGHYALAIATASAAEFRVVATAASDRADPLCQILSIDQSGRRLAMDSRGADSSRRCW